MTTRARIGRGEAGFTIAELLVASFISLLVLNVVFAAVRVQGRGAAVQAGIADSQLTTGGAVEILNQDLRMAGYGMLGVDPAATVSGAPIDPVTVTQSGSTTTITLRGNYSNVSTSLAVASALNATTITVTPPAVGVFKTGNLVVIDSRLDSEVRQITNIATSGGNQVLTLSDPPLPVTFPVGPEVTQLETIAYTYDGTLLRRNGQVVADNASSFQLQYIDQTGAVTNTPGLNLRSVTLSIVSKQPTKLPDSPSMQSSASTETNMRNLSFRFSLS